MNLYTLGKSVWDQSTAVLSIRAFQGALRVSIEEEAFSLLCSVERSLLAHDLFSNLALGREVA